MKKKTKTRNFGSGGRESHDSSSFYKLFGGSNVTKEDSISVLTKFNLIYNKSSENMAELPDNSVGLVVTSPPYYVGKDYELNTKKKHVPTSYGEYLEKLSKVLQECHRVLEPGGRACVNVANLGRKPYISLSSDVMNVLKNSGFLLRGEIIWVKAKGAGGSCAWGSYRSAVNPVLRDVTERIIVVSKNRFDRALTRKTRESKGLPYKDTISKEDFLECTLDTWFIPAESARKIGHPAPYPTELARKLIEMYSFENDIVLDPYLGSGTTAVAALATGRRFIGYETEADYVRLAEDRVRDLLESLKGDAD